MKKGNIELIQGDCMDVMGQYEDNYFDLAIVDPPYGIEKGFQATSRIAKYGQMKTVNDLRPNDKYITELFRVSKNQIIWGFNHLSDLLPTTKEFIFWYKHQPVDTYSDGELAWTSFLKTAKCFDYRYWGAINKDNVRIHPTQKPIALYDWIYKTYSSKDQKILDTHLGSGSNAISAYYFGVAEFVGVELDKGYFKGACKRVDEQTNQLTLF